MATHQGTVAMTAPPVHTDPIVAAGDDIDHTHHVPDDVDLLLYDLGGCVVARMTVTEAGVVMAVALVHHGGASLPLLRLPEVASQE